MVTATCHCGAVTIEVSKKPEALTECNCSICRRYGVRWAYYTRKTARVLCGPGATSTYMWGDKTIRFHHCNTCGCVTHYEDVDASDAGRIAVNANNMPPELIADVPVRHFDGAKTWKYINE